MQNETMRFTETESDRASSTAACRSARVLWSSLIQRGVAWNEIEPNFELLDAVEGLSSEEFRQDPFRRKGAERMLQEAIDVAVYTNIHLPRTPAGFSSTA